MIPNEVIEEVLARTDIEQLISGYVTLKRAGSNLQGLCPFHSERSPSLPSLPQVEASIASVVGQGETPFPSSAELKTSIIPMPLNFWLSARG